MPETKENTRRWNGYVCPECRLVFRVPKNHDELGIQCPNCSKLLRLPPSTDLLAPSDPNLRNTQGTAENFSSHPAHPVLDQLSEPVSRREGLKKKRRHSHASDEPAWEKEPEETHVRVRKSYLSRMLVWAVTGGLLVVLLLGLTLLWKRSRTMVAPVVVVPTQKEVTEIKTSEPDPIDLPEEMQVSQSALVDELKPLANSFLNAASVEDLLKVIRDPQGVKEKLKAYYPEGKVPPLGMNAFNVSGKLIYRKNLASFDIRTNTFEEKPIVFIRTDEGMKVDWESFVAWSEMPWGKFLNEKPDRSIFFRVSLRPLDYYNFEFSDEKEWQSYEIVSADQEHIIYGYVKRDSELNQKLMPLDAKSARMMMLKLRFLSGARSKNQVLIDEIVGDGWVKEEVE